MIRRPPKILVIKSNSSELEKVERFLKEILDEFSVDKKNFNKIYLCVSEAVINSIKHGNKHDPNKDVKIEVEYNSKEIIVRVEDEGEGFELNKLKDPTRQENIKNESGRGIFIIKSLSNELQFNERGNRIQLKIECQ